MLNRGVVIVRPKQPYLDWAAGLDDSGVVPNPDDEQTVYLIPSYASEDEAWEILKVNYRQPLMTTGRMNSAEPSS
jgi:hypothetical protein